MRIKKIVPIILALALLSGCGEPSFPSRSSNPVSSKASSIEESSTFSKSESVLESSESDDDSPIEMPELSELLTKYMKDSFGGGDDHPEFATSWYKYIDTITVLKDGDTYRVEVRATDSPADAMLRGYTAAYSLGDAYDSFIASVMDAQYALGLEDLDGCLIADSLYKILTSDSGVKVYYASLFSYGINAYKYISDATNGEFSESYVLDTADYLCGADFVNAILTGMQNEFQDSCDAFVTYDADRIAYSIKANYRDILIAQVDIINPQGTIVHTVK